LALGAASAATCSSTPDSLDAAPSGADAAAAFFYTGAMGETNEDRFRALGLTLPEPPQRKGLYVPVQRQGNLLHISGHPPLLPGGTYLTGRVGADLTVEQGKEAARLTALAVLATLRAELGSLNRVRKLVRSLGMVNATPDFQFHPKVKRRQSGEGEGGQGRRQEDLLPSITASIETALLLLLLLLLLFRLL